MHDKRNGRAYNRKNMTKPNGNGPKTQDSDDFVTKRKNLKKTFQVGSYIFKQFTQLHKKLKLKQTDAVTEALADWIEKHSK